MCLGVPGQVIETHDNAFMRMGKVDFWGVTREVCLAYTPEARVNEYVLVHVGFAINVIDEAEAKEVFSLLQQLAEDIESKTVLTWLSLDRQNVVGQVISLPTPEQIDTHFDGKAVIEYYSR